MKYKHISFEELETKTKTKQFLCKNTSLCPTFSKRKVKLFSKMLFKTTMKIFKEQEKKMIKNTKGEYAP